MRRKVRQQIARDQRRIQRRLDRENRRRADSGKPVLEGTGARYEIASRLRAVGAGGLGLIHQMARSLGLIEAIDKRVHLLRFHLPYHESDHVINIAYNLLAGGECLEHLELLRNDESYMDMLGACRIPDPTTAGDFCRRFRCQADIDALQAAINETSLRAWKQQPDEFFEHAYIDADGTMVDASPTSQGADFSHKRRFCYHPLIVTLANTGEVLSLENRPGPRPSSEGAAARLDEAIALVRRAGFRSVTMRGDTDFSQSEYLDSWDQAGVRFVFGYACYENLLETADSLPDSAWRRLDRDEKYTIKTEPRTRPINIRELAAVKRNYRNIHLLEENVAEFDYKPSRCDTSFRIVVVRKLVTHEKGQDLLYPEIRYFFYVTNRRDVTAREIVRLANTRCAQERIIGQLKSGVECLRAPLDNLHSNWAYMVCAALAWNLSKWFALLIPVNARWGKKHREEKRAVLTMNFRNFVAAFMRVPAQVVKTSRKVKLRLLACNIWQHVFFRGLDGVRALE